MINDKFSERRFNFRISEQRITAGEYTDFQSSDSSIRNRKNDEDIVIYLIANDHTIPFYEKLKWKTEDVLRDNRVEWTAVAVEEGMLSEQKWRFIWLLQALYLVSVRLLW